jgi:uncharacterized protein involved in exopolysaccharide biosynthesis
MHMELRELINLFKKEKVLFGCILSGFLVIGLLWVALEPKRFESNILITIGRTEGGQDQAVSDYQYDNYYRLQADERYGDTLVRLLATPQVTRDIFEGADLANATPAGTFFEGRKLSSQIVEITFTDTDKSKLAPLGVSLTQVLNRYTSELQSQTDGQKNWFRIVASEPVITDARTSTAQVFGIALFFGLFIGFWAVLIKHYLSQPQPKKE